MTHKATFAVVLALLLSSVVFADPPRIMNYQAKLTNSDGVALDGDYSITFRIYDAATGGTLLWHQTKTVTVTNGLFDEQLDLSINGGDTLKFNRPYWIALEVGSDGEMTPREKLAPVSFAFRSIYADTADYTSGALTKQDFRLGPEGTNSRIRGLVSSCSELPSSGSLTWTEVTDHTGVPYNFCISSAFTFGDPWYAAEAACEDLGGRLCTRSEYRSFYGQTHTSVQNYWTAALCSYSNSTPLIEAVYCSSIDCISRDRYLVYNNLNYRCCVPLK